MIWIKQNGQEIEINDYPANIAAAKSLGWKLKEEAEEKEPVKRGRKPKVTE